MRARWLLVLLTACGEEGPGPAAATPPPVDAFLRMLPPDVSVVVRLPSVRAAKEDPGAVAALLGMLGRGAPHAVLHGSAEAAGLDPDASPGLAATPSGGWVHYLPAADKAALHRALGPRAADVVVREEGPWVIVSGGGAVAARFEDAPLLPGALSLRVRHHPLLAAVAQPGDMLEAAFTLAGGGFDVHGRLVPAPDGTTAELLRDARAFRGGLLDFLPGSLGLRAETALPPAMLATWLARRAAVHASIREEADRIVLERLLREALTGADPEAGVAFGVEAREGSLSFVALGRVAGGPTSPVLARVRRERRSAFGPLVLDARDGEGVTGFHAWIAEGRPALEGLPEAAWPLAAALCGGEEGGLPLAFLEQEGWWVFGGGPRADLLVRDAARRLRQGSQRSPGSASLQTVRERGRGDYVLGIVAERGGLLGLPAADRAALAAALGALPDARAPEAVAVAGFRRDGAIAIEGRALYASP